MADNTLVQPEVIATAGAAGIGVLALVRKAMTWFSKERASSSFSKAEADLIDGLRSELGRLGDVNGQLSTRLNTMQVSLLDLNLELSQLRVANSELMHQVAGLQTKNSELGAEIVELTNQIAKMNDRRGN